MRAGAMSVPLSTIFQKLEMGHSTKQVFNARWRKWSKEWIYTYLVLGLEEANCQTEGQNLLTGPLHMDPDTLDESLFIDSSLVVQTKSKPNKIKRLFANVSKLMQHRWTLIKFMGGWNIGQNVKLFTYMRTTWNYYAKQPWLVGCSINYLYFCLSLLL